MQLTTHHHLEQRLRKSGAILPLYPLMVWTGKTLPLYLLLALLSELFFFFGIQDSVNSFRLAFTALATFLGVPIIHTHVSI
jgi:hypothetical protein